ncbi:unnamed protein product, partial [marine sediment metagenome]
DEGNIDYNYLPIASFHRISLLSSLELILT